MIDVVYPMANLSKHRDDWELRYSLRSLAQQSWVRNIYLIGHRPKWATGLTHIPFPDPYTACKDANLINKILNICYLPELSDNFLVNSDDQYVLHPVSEEDFAPLLENPNRFAEFKMKAGTNSWHRRVVDTVSWCKQHGYSDWIFQSHTPYIVNKQAYPQVMQQVPWGRGNSFTTHIYQNMTVKQTPEKEPIGRNVRIKTKVRPEQLTQLAKTAAFFNHNDAGLQPCVKEWIERLFPHKSRWEI